MKIQNILISQPKPVDFDKSPYADIAKKHDVSIDFVKFFTIEGVQGADFRKSRINILDYSAIILMSKHAVDHFFRITKELRLEIPDTMKYFCINEATALYLQRYITYRKRKIFFSKTNISELLEIIIKHKNEKYLIPSADVQGGIIAKLLLENDINPMPTQMFQNVSVNLKEKIDLNKYQLIVIFSPYGLFSLTENYPDFKDREIVIGVLGKNVAISVENSGLPVGFMAPTPEYPSITTAIDAFLKKSNKDTKKH